MGASPSGRNGRKGVWAWLYSPDLTLWLLGLLIAWMAVGTVVPQHARREVYERAFGQAFGGLIARSSLSGIYGSWWFIALFALLGVNLAACVVKRLGTLRRAKSAAAAAVTASQVRGQRAVAEFTAKLSLQDAAQRLTQVLRHRGYDVSVVDPGAGEAAALRARRGRARAWGPLVVHLGLLVLLVGAAYGRWPSLAFDQPADVRAGETHRVEIGDLSFGIRLLDAGIETTPEGAPSQYWAETQIVDGGKVVRDVRITPNHPLRYRGTNVVLNSLYPLSAPDYAVEVAKGDSVSYVPVVLDEHGHVDMMASVTHVEDPPWLAWVSDFRPASSQDELPAALVSVDESGAVSPDRRDVGWVSAGGIEYNGVHFELVEARGGKQVQLGVHRDLGIPLVWTGFGLMLVGSVLAFFVTRRDIVARLASGPGRGTTILLGASAVGFGPAPDRTVRSLQADLSASEEVDTA
ncbi:MAG: cytochrome c biogenesis protein ResB [Armatimonadota bacterium]|nr:MAG: cytochrome c biogenesis protein ResB [Armatimonadota bacterium]